MQFTQDVRICAVRTAIRSTNNRICGELDTGDSIALFSVYVGVVFDGERYQRKDDPFKSGDRVVAHINGYTTTINNKKYICHMWPAPAKYSFPPVPIGTHLVPEGYIFAYDNLKRLGQRIYISKRGYLKCKTYNEDKSVELIPEDVNKYLG